MSKQNDMGFALTNEPKVTHTFTSVIAKMKADKVNDKAIAKVQRIRELTKQSKATTFELMKNLHDIFENEKLLKSMGYGKGEFCLMCNELFALPKEISSKYATSGAFVIVEDDTYKTPFAQTDDLGFVTDITPTALIEMTFPKKYNDKGITLEVFTNFWNAYIEKCEKMPTTKQIRQFKKAVLQLLDDNEKLLENGFDAVVALLETPQTEDKKTEDKKTEDKKTEDKKTEDKKTEDKTDEKPVVPTQQNDNTEFENTVPEFGLAELAEMLKDKMDEIANTDPTQLYDMFGAEIMELFGKAIASKVKAKTKAKRQTKKKTEPEKTEPEKTEVTE